MNIFRNPVILLVLVLLAFLLFGANKLPKMARNLGQSMRILKSEVKEMKTDGKNGKDEKKSTEEDTEAVEGTVISNGETTTSKEQSSQQ
jgi:sec-independent protein translocase protein TatA